MVVALDELRADTIGLGRTRKREGVKGRPRRVVVVDEARAWLTSPLEGVPKLEPG